MAYTIVKSDGTVLTSIADGTINTTSTSVGLPGRNYAGYGQTLDTNFVHQIESYAASTPPAYPLRGQLWYNTNTSTLNVCPADGAPASSWLALTSTSSGGTTTFGAVTVTGTVQANNLTATNYCNAANGVFTNISVSANANVATANVTTGIVGSLTTTTITTGSSSTAGSLTGAWTINGGPGGLNSNAVVFNTGGIYINNTGNLYGIKTDRYMYANGDPISFAGKFNDSNVALYLPIYNGNVLATKIQTPILTTGSNVTGGTMTGTWTLSTGSQLQATYADLAERFEADAEYDPGTVVELGGEKEITEVALDLSDTVFGVVSNTAAYLMNSGAGTSKTHPAIAVSGRVQVKVSGRVKKGDRLVSAGKGKARAAQMGEASAFNTIGRSLVNKDDEGTGTVEAIVTIK